MERDLKDSEIYEVCYGFKERRSNTRFFILLLAIAFVFLGIRYSLYATFGGVIVDGRSMNYTLYSGEKLVMKYSDGSDAKRGDVIVVGVEHYPEVQKKNEGKPESEKLKFLIKRLIAIEGDTVKCTDGQIYIKYAGEEKFEALDEPYNPHYSLGKPSYDFAEYKVGKGEIFFLGDNRNNSIDSRYQEYDSNGNRCSNIDRLYKAEDIKGIVPQWAIKYQVILEKIFF